jgi:hypothetical protein
MFSERQEVMYLPEGIKATVHSSGSTMTSIIIYDMGFSGGRFGTSLLTVNNIELMELGEYLSKKREDKINEIINE